MSFLFSWLNQFGILEGNTNSTTEPAKTPRIKEPDKENLSDNLSTTKSVTTTRTKTTKKKSRRKQTLGKNMTEIEHQVGVLSSDEQVDNDPFSGLSLAQDEEKSEENQGEVESSGYKLFPTKKQLISPEALEYLTNELRKLMKSDLREDGITIEPVDDNLFVWDVSFTYPEDCDLYEQLKMYSEETGRNCCVKAQVTFPPNYPKFPPFLRVVYPRFHQYTGHITIGGSVCIKDLTLSGWNQEYQISQFLIMIRNTLLEGGALVDMGYLEPYSQYEAENAFKRVATQHGWQI